MENILNEDMVYLGELADQYSQENYENIFDLSEKLGEMRMDHEVKLTEAKNKLRKLTEELSR